MLDDPNLSATARLLIEDPANDFAISPASYWEIAIKIRNGDSVLSEPYEVFFTREIAANDFEIIPVEPKHTAILTTLPLHHKAPFDRLIIAQAMREALPLISADAQLDAYPIRRHW